MRPVKTWVVRYWRGYLSGARCKWFAYGPTDATATSSSLAAVKSRMVYLSSAGLPRLSWKKRPLNGCSSNSSSSRLTLAANYVKPGLSFTLESNCKLILTTELVSESDVHLFPDYLSTSRIVALHNEVNNTVPIYVWRGFLWVSCWFGEVKCELSQWFSLVVVSALSSIQCLDTAGGPMV